MRHAGWVGISAGTVETTATGGLVDDLVELGRAVLGADGGADGSADPEPLLLAAHPKATVVRLADVVVKAHVGGTRPEELNSRLSAVRHPLLSEVLLAPLPVAGRYLHRVRDRLVTVWPYGRPVRPDPDDAPWEQAARLLACLHAVPVAPVAGGSPLPPAGGPARVLRALRRLADARVTGAAVTEVHRAFDTLPDWLRAGRPQQVDQPVLIHGDWHLGQLVQSPAGWRLIDVDDFGVGDPTWDLGRPAAWYATGLLPPEEWHRFVSAYRAAGGWAVPPVGNVLPALDLPARALVVQAAALALVAAEREQRPLDEVEQALVDGCVRIARVPRAPAGKPAPGPGSGTARTAPEPAEKQRGEHPYDQK